MVLCDYDFFSNGKLAILLVIKAGARKRPIKIGFKLMPPFIYIFIVDLH